MHRQKGGKRLSGAGWIISGSIRQGLCITCLCLLMMGSVDAHTFTRQPVYTMNAESVDSCIKVACIGASTTFGGNIENQPLNGFPEQLQRMLGGAHWTVRNFGVNGAGVLNKGEIPYRKTIAWQAAIAFLPDIVLLNLGVNDVKPGSWVFKKDFIHDYAALIADLRKLPTKPKIYLCLEVPVFKDRWGIRRQVVETELSPLKKWLAHKYSIPLIDLYTPLLQASGLFADGIHPDKKGATIIAKTIAATLHKDYPSITSLPERRADDTAMDSLKMFPGKMSYWKGFLRYDFFLGLREARLVVPKHPAKGAPWVWRARFPDWHTEMDSILLEGGFYVFYLNTDGLLGAPQAIGSWDQAYRYLLQYYQLNQQVAMEGVSRGALFIYAFAKKFPERISCIYAEAPVCDIKSWPGGFLRGPGDAEAWATLKQVYHFNEKEALAYQDNPIDHLEPLAKRKIPIWHSIGLLDSLAPPAENTFILAKRYIELGGPITIYPNTKSVPSLHGHHFEIDDPEAGARFIMANVHL